MSSKRQLDGKNESLSRSEPARWIHPNGVINLQAIDQLSLLSGFCQRRQAGRPCFIRGNRRRNGTDVG